jgi:arylsulfatase A-like enzyme
LVSVLETGDEPLGWRDAVHWEHDFRHNADWLLDSHPEFSPHRCSLAVIRDNCFKYVHFAALPPLLYDLKNDPGEMTDLSCHPDYLAVRLEYAEKLLQLRMRFTARGLTETLLTPDGPVTHSAPP